MDTVRTAMEVKFKFKEFNATKDPWKHKFNSHATAAGVIDSAYNHNNISTVTGLLYLMDRPAIESLTKVNVSRGTRGR